MYMLKEIINRVRAQARYDIDNHMHYVSELYKNGHNYYIDITETEGRGNILCENALVCAAIKAQPDYSMTKDYQVDMIPVVQYTKSQKTRKRLAPQRSMQVQVQVQAGGQFPPDMNFDGCADLSLNLDGDLKEAIYYSEPIVEYLKKSGAIGIYKKPTPEQKQVIMDYVRSSPPMGPVEYVISKLCSIGLVKPTFDQFRVGLDDTFPAGLDAYSDQVRAAGLTVTAASWDDGSYQIPIMLDHLHNHAYAHNGMQEEGEIRELMDLLGGRSITTAHVVHSLLHVYDTLYMIRKSEQSWEDYMDYLETILNIIPDERERRCFFQLVNRRADQFLAKDKDEYIAPYQMIPDAIPDKTRQYSRRIAQLIIPFGHQLRGTPMPQTGTTTLLPNQDAQP